MALTPGSRLGSYEVVALLGAGGMGEVYRARDTRLNRVVAIKALPDLFAQDAERAARLQREAQVLASLNHPHIAAIHGVEELGDRRFLVLEFVDGQSLADVIRARGDAGLGVDESLSLARQILDALEAAHEKGIIHRDIKPANIMITADGQVKVLDFGLARINAPESGADVSTSPTLTAMSTQMGMILGTAAYMSPEQAKGRVADKRSDVWAFGCVLYEMLTGVRAFEGEDVSDTLAAILRGEPDWTRLPPATPPGVVSLVKRCLTRDRKARIPEISTVRFLLDDALLAPASAGPASVVVAAPPKPWWRRALPSAITAVAAVAFTATATWLLVRPRPAAAPQPMRFSIVPAATQPLLTLGDRTVAISPDGTHLAYVSGGSGDFGNGGALIVRTIDRLDAEPLRGITNGRAPFFSPDGKWIGFFDGSEALKKVSIAGGPPITLCPTGSLSRGATWGPDGTIVFATTSSAGLQVVPAGGGAPKALMTLDPSQREGAHLFPSFLPDGRGILFTMAASVDAGNGETSQIAVLDLKSGQRKILIRGGSQPAYVAAPGGPGYLLYATAGTLRAVRFDPATYEVLSDPVALVDQVAMGVSVGSAHYAMSRGGALVYVIGSSAGGGGAVQSLAWVDRQGHEAAINAPPRTYVAVRLSPDGTRLALDVRDQENDIWIWELARQTLTRLTFDRAPDTLPVWTPDGRRVVFASSRAGVNNLYWQPADGTGTVERLTTARFGQFPTSFSPDGKQLVVVENRPTTNFDLSLMEMDGKSAPAPIIPTTFQEYNGEVSPDGRWIAYQSNESPPSQIYVRPFPNVNAGRWQISSSGGTKPVWAPNGRELFFIDDKHMLTSVPVQTTPAFAPGPATKLFELKNAGAAVGRPYDVSRDGKRFVVIKDNAAAGGGPAGAPPPSLTVVLNWTEELKQRVK